MKKIILAAIIGAVIAVPVVKKTISGSAQKTVQVEALQEQVITRSILASGNLQHQEKVQLSTEVIGNVKRIFVKEGDRISKGQLLLQIDDEAYRSATEQQQAMTDLLAGRIHARCLGLPEGEAVRTVSSVRPMALKNPAAQRGVVELREDATRVEPGQIVDCFTYASLL